MKLKELMITAILAGAFLTGCASDSSNGSMDMAKDAATDKTEDVKDGAMDKAKDAAGDLKDKTMGK
jgi:hypothetical protein